HHSTSTIDNTPPEDLVNLVGEFNCFKPPRDKSKYTTYHHHVDSAALCPLSEGGTCGFRILVADGRSGNWISFAETSTYWKLATRHASSRLVLLLPKAYVKTLWVSAPGCHLLATHA